MPLRLTIFCRLARYTFASACCRYTFHWMGPQVLLRDFYCVRTWAFVLYHLGACACCTTAIPLLCAPLLHCTTATYCGARINVCKHVVWARRSQISYLCHLSPLLPPACLTDVISSSLRCLVVVRCRMPATVTPLSLDGCTTFYTTFTHKFWNTSILGVLLTAISAHYRHYTCSLTLSRH